jgi:anti-sigma28 factor (negative regulator of flagellin synthesis)
MSDQNNDDSKAPRRRGLTSMTLQWLAEKLRRAEKIKAELHDGTYQVDTSKVAQAILNGEGEATK